MLINWKVRFHNPVFIVQLALSIVTPVLTYMGMTWQDFTTWKCVWDTVVSAFSNPSVVIMMIICAWNALNDPTTSGLSDSALAMSYNTPKVKE